MPRTNTMRFAEYPTNSHIEGPVYLTKSEIRKDKNGNNYLSVTCSDGQETLMGNIWSYGEDTALPEGVYQINGAITEYMGRRQLSSFELTPDKNADPSPFVIKYEPPTTLPDPRNSIELMIQHIYNDVLRNAVAEIMAPRMDRFCSASSAVAVHHVGATGNIYHTIEVVQTAAAIASKYIQLGYPVNLDLVTAGALLHDIGKLDTYVTKPGKVTMTAPGQLLDHTVLGILVLSESDTLKANPETMLLLQHIIASHHGVLEYGAAVTPRCLEAVIVSTADRLSKDINAAYTGMQSGQLSEDGFTDKIWAMNNDRFLSADAVGSMLAENHQKESV